MVIRKIHDQYLQMMFSANNLIVDVKNTLLDEQVGYMRNMTSLVVPETQTIESTISALYDNILHISRPSCSTSQLAL